jgi:hypothetical protein
LTQGNRPICKASGKLPNGRPSGSRYLRPTANGYAESSGVRISVEPRRPDHSVLPDSRRLNAERISADSEGSTICCSIG